MKVFCAKRDGSYSGGLILVAANDKEEAILTAARTEKYKWMFDWVDDNGNCIYEDDGNTQHIHSNYYPIERWHEVENLEYKGNTPTVIIEDGYSE